MALCGFCSFKYSTKKDNQWQWQPPLPDPPQPLSDLLLPSLYSDKKLAPLNYCSKCGASLWETCTVCGGSGTITTQDYNRTYCSACGQLISYSSSIKEKCLSCGGSGRKRESHFCVR